MNRATLNPNGPQVIKEALDNPERNVVEIRYYGPFPNVDAADAWLRTHRRAGAEYTITWLRTP